MVQGRPMVLVAAHSCIDEWWVLRDEATNVAFSIKRNRRPEIEPSAMGEKICRNVLAQSCQGSCPAKYADLVVVALAKNIGTRFDQERNDVQVCSFRGKVQGIRIVAVVANPNVRAAIEQQPHAGGAIAPRSHVQCCASPVVASAGVDQVEVQIEQLAEFIGQTFFGSVEDGFNCLLYQGGTISARLEITGKELNLLIAVGLANLVDG